MKVMAKSLDNWEIKQSPDLPQILWRSGWIFVFGSSPIKWEQNFSIIPFDSNKWVFFLLSLLTFYFCITFLSFSCLCDKAFSRICRFVGLWQAGPWVCLLYLQTCDLWAANHALCHPNPSTSPTTITLQFPLGLFMVVAMQIDTNINRS